VISAEVLGMAIGINLLFDTYRRGNDYGLDTFIVVLINKGIRKMEAFIITLLWY
jgi:Mn2+/Fe2+ NRAMP family transporter